MSNGRHELPVEDCLDLIKYIESKPHMDYRITRSMVKITGVRYLNLDLTVVGIRVKPLRLAVTEEIPRREKSSIDWGYWLLERVEARDTK